MDEATQNMLKEAAASLAYREQESTDLRAQLGLARKSASEQARFRQDLATVVFEEIKAAGYECECDATTLATEPARLSAVLKAAFAASASAPASGRGVKLDTPPPKAEKPRYAGF